MSLKQKVDDLNTKILNGQILPAFEEYYADDVVMEDVGSQIPARNGKDAARVHEEQFVGGITAFHGADVKNVVVQETGDGSGIAYSEWFMHFDHSGYGNDTKMAQVAVQEWKDGKIVRERFYHA
jgi:hypothetical protein